MKSVPEAVITGAGAVSPHGRGVPVLWDGVISGRTAFSPLTVFDASAFRNPLAGVVDGYPALDDGDKYSARALRMLKTAALEALQQALNLPPDSTYADIAAMADRDETLHHGAIITGSNFGGMGAAEKTLGVPGSHGGSLAGYLFGAAGDMLAELTRLEGARMNISLSCASGTAAIGLARDMVRQGRADFVLVCGYDELSLYAYAGLSALRAITPETIRPFDRRRKGTLFSEGAGVVVVESAERAIARKSPVLAKLIGSAVNNDAYHMTAPEQEAKGIRLLIKNALTSAHTTPDQIDHVNLHATGTPYNDAIETRAVHDVFGARGNSIPVCSIKSSIGHTMGAAGTLETIVALKTIETGLVPAVAGLDPAEKDPACDLNTPCGAPLKGNYKRVLKTSYGFGGTNAAIVLEAV